MQTHGGVKAPISIPVLASSQAGRSVAINLFAGSCQVGRVEAPECSSCKAAEWDQLGEGISVGMESPADTLCISPTGVGCPCTNPPERELSLLLMRDQPQHPGGQ